MLIIILFLRLKRGLNQTNGRASGPTHKKAIMIQRVLKNHFSTYFLLPFDIKRIPIMIRTAQIIKAAIDFGPETSFTGLPIIMSKVEINITPKTPNTIKKIPFFFIPTSILNKNLVASSLASLGSRHRLLYR